MARQATINSEYFTLDEFTKSATAQRCGINNNPSPAIVANLQYGVSMILEPLRRYMQEPIIITSGFRCKELNEVVRGVPNSWHCLGNAADIHVSGKEDAAKKFAFLKRCASVDTVLFEHSGRSQWIHVQWDVSKTPRHRANFNYIAKLIVLLFVLVSSASCRSSQATVQHFSQKDSVSTLMLTEKSGSFIVVRDSAFPEIMPLLLTPLPCDIDTATLSKLKKNTVAFGNVNQVKAIITQSVSKNDSTVKKNQPQEKNKDETSKVNLQKLCRFVIFLLFFFVFICLVVSFRKKIKSFLAS